MLWRFLNRQVPQAAQATEGAARRRDDGAAAEALQKFDRPHAESKPNRLPEPEASAVKGYRSNVAFVVCAVCGVIALASLAVSWRAHLQTGREQTQPVAKARSGREQTQPVAKARSESSADKGYRSNVFAAVCAVCAVCAVIGLALQTEWPSHLETRRQDQKMQTISAGVYSFLYHMGNTIAIHREVGDGEAMEPFYVTAQDYAQHLERNIREGLSLGLLQHIAGEHDQAPAELSYLLSQLNRLSAISVSESNFYEYFVAPETTCVLVRLANQCAKYRKPLFEGQHVRESMARLVAAMKEGGCEIRGSGEYFRAPRSFDVFPKWL